MQSIARDIDDPQLWNTVSRVERALDLLVVTQDCLGHYSNAEPRPNHALHED